MFVKLTKHAKVRIAIAMRSIIPILKIIQICSKCNLFFFTIVENSESRNDYMNFRKNVQIKQLSLHRYTIWDKQLSNCEVKDKQ